MTIGKKIGAGYGLALSALVAVGALSYWGTSKLIETSHWVMHTHQVLEEAEALQSAMMDAETGKRGYLLTGREPYLEPYKSARAEVDRSMAALKSLTRDNDDQQQRLAKLQVPIDEKFRELQQAIDLRRERGLPAAMEVVNSDRGLRLMAEARRLLKEVHDAEAALLKKREADADRVLRAIYTSIGLGTLLAVLLVSAGGLLVTRSITGPLGRLLEGIEKIGRGELDYRLNLEAGDEIGTLARAFDRMAEKRQRALEMVREAVSRLTSTGAEILASTTQQAAGAQEQAAAIAQTVATVDEVTQTASQAAQRAKGVGEAVRRSNEVGRTGREAIEGSIASLDRLKEQVESTAGDILMLAEQAQAIGEIIATVNDIAEQTNMLALNAAIEASRAGEHGRGFAVVATEVKALADQSKKATGQVRQILGEIQKATNTAVLSTEEVTKGVAAAIQAAGQSGETIHALAETLTDASEASSQIVASAGQQATGMVQISQAMKNIDQVARQNLAAMRQAEQAAQNLNALGNQLTGLASE